MINGRNVLDQPVKNYIKTHKNVQKIAADQRDNYITYCLLDYLQLKNTIRW